MSDEDYSPHDNSFMRDLERSIFRLGRSLRTIRVSHQDSSTYATGAGFWELVLLQLRGPLRATEMATTLSLDISTVSRQLKQLSTEGLIEKEQDPNDARAYVVRLTSHGTQVVNELMSRREALIEQSLSSWSPTDRQTFQSLLNRFATDLESGHSDGSRIQS
jgi:DNA-binding MarR family transcriptional regulator